MNKSDKAELQYIIDELEIVNKKRGLETRQVKLFIKSTINKLKLLV